MKFVCCFWWACGLLSTSGSRLIVSASSTDKAASAAASPIATCGMSTFPEVSEMLQPPAGHCDRRRKPQQLDVSLAVGGGKGRAGILLCLRRASKKGANEQAELRDTPRPVPSPLP